MEWFALPLDGRCWSTFLAFRSIRLLLSFLFAKRKQERCHCDDNRKIRTVSLQQLLSRFSFLSFVGFRFPFTNHRTTRQRTRVDPCSCDFSLQCRHACTICPQYWSVEATTHTQDASSDGCIMNPWSIVHGVSHPCGCLCVVPF